MIDSHDDYSLLGSDAEGDHSAAESDNDNGRDNDLQGNPHTMLRHTGVRRRIHNLSARIDAAEAALAQRRPVQADDRR